MPYAINDLFLTNDRKRSIYKFINSYLFIIQNIPQFQLFQLPLKDRKAAFNGVTVWVVDRRVRPLKPM